MKILTWNMQKKKQLENELEIISQLQDLDTAYDEDILVNLIELLHNTSNLIRIKRNSYLGHQKYLRDLEKKCEGNVKLMKTYNKATEDTKEQMYMISNWINNALNLNKQICYILAEISGNINLMASNCEVNFSKQSNMKLLHDPERIKNKLDLMKHTHTLLNKEQIYGSNCGKKQE